MKRDSFKLEVSEAIGSVSAEYLIPSASTCIMTLAHGAGAGMNHSFMTELANALARVHIATLRFNFPFTESGKKRVDVPAVAHKTIEAALQHAHEHFHSLPLFAAGKSFGGRMTSQALAIQSVPFVNGIIFFGFPLHTIGKPSIVRAEHLKDAAVPMLFLQGTRDELATLSLIKEVCATLEKATLVEIEGANHAFKAGKKDVIGMLADEAKLWVNRILSA